MLHGYCDGNKDKALAIGNGSTQPGQTALIWTKIDDTPDQMWRFESVDA